MNCCNITFRDIPKAIKHQWKIFSVILAGCLAIGCVCGILFSKNATNTSSGQAEDVDTVDFEDVLPSLNYYNDCYIVLYNQYQNLYQYWNGIQDKLSVPVSYQESLNELGLSIKAIQKDYLTPIQKNLNQTSMFYIRNDMHTEALKEYQRLKEQTQESLSRSEHAMALINSIGGLSTTDTEVNSLYSDILSLASQYAQLQINLKTYEYRMTLLESNDAVLAQNSHAMEQDLQDCLDNLNQIAEECNQLFDQIAMDLSLELSMVPINGTPSLDIIYGNRSISKTESFVAFLVFFSLAGICIGCFFALYKECSHTKMISESNTTEY